MLIRNYMIYAALLVVLLYLNVLSERGSPANPRRPCAGPLGALWIGAKCGCMG